MKGSQEMTDLQLTRLNWLVESVCKENANQLNKWGVQTHSPFLWMTVLTEEVGELAQAILEHNFAGDRASAVYAEAIQCATVSLKIAEMYFEEFQKQGCREALERQRERDKES